MDDNKLTLSEVGVNRGVAIPLRLTWPELVDRLTTSKIIYCPNWTNKAARDTAKAKAGGWTPCTFASGHRTLADAQTAQVLALDLDDVPTGVMSQACARLNQMDFDWIAHTTYSHGTALGLGRWRLVVLLDRPVDVDDYATCVRALAHLLGLTDHMDPQSVEIERLMYWPAHAQRRPFYFRSPDLTRTPDEGGLL